jgi:hypothetical protein
MNDKGELGGKGVEVERAAQGLVAKCWYLGMVSAMLCADSLEARVLNRPAVPESFGAAL